MCVASISRWRMRSKPRSELFGLTPGIPGSQRSSAPWTIASRRPSSVETSSRSGIHGASPITVVTRGWSAAAIATAPPIEKPSSASSSAPSPTASERAARQSSMHHVSRFHDLIRYRTSTNETAGKSGARRRTATRARAPGALDLAGGAAVDADHRPPAARVRHARLRAGCEPDGYLARSPDPLAAKARQPAPRTYDHARALIGATLPRRAGAARDRPQLR